MTCRIAKPAMYPWVPLLVAACLLGGSIGLAHAMSTSGRVIVVPTPPAAGASATYTLSTFKVSNKETVIGYTITFPAGIDPSGATSAGVGDVVTIAPDGQTVTVMLGTSVPGPATLALSLGGITNPATPGTYAFDSVTFHRQGAADQVIDISARTFTISPPPYLTMTVTTPGAGQTVDFGAIPPEVTTPGADVSLAIDSGVPYDLTRSVTGQAAEMGLAVTGAANGVNFPAGPSTYVDTYTATPPWTSDPDVPFTATVTYTVVQH